MIETVHLLGICLILILYVVMKWSGGKKLGKMPGPTPLPILGNVHQLDSVRPYLTFTKWAKEYGDVFAIRLLSQDTVVVNSAELTREALFSKGSAFAGRPYYYRADCVFHNGNDICFRTYTPNLIHIRKVTHSVLKSYGVGMIKLENIILKGVREMLHEMASHVDEPFCPRETIHRAICNILLTIVTGKEFKPTDHEVCDLIKYDILVSEVISPADGVELDAFPWLRFFGNKCYKKLTEAIKFRDEFFVKQFKSLKETFNPSQIRGVYDGLLLQQEQDAATDSPERLTDIHIEAAINDLVIAGTITTVSALDIAILSLIHYPDVQKKLHQEIELVLGNRFPHIEDRNMMPYTEAFMLELLRYGSHVPLMLPHFTMEDTVLAGYEIPKNTQVLFNTFAIHHGEQYYEDPWTIKPERFLDGDGNLLPADHPARKNFFAFGAGRRLCLGENFAKVRLFLFMAAFIQRFEVLQVDSEPLPSFDPRDFKHGTVLFPKPYQIRLVERK